MIRTTTYAAATNKYQDHTESRIQWMVAFGVGTVLLGVGGVCFPFSPLSSMLC